METYSNGTAARGIMARLGGVLLLASVAAASVLFLLALEGAAPATAQPAPTCDSATLAIDRGPNAVFGDPQLPSLDKVDDVMSASSLTIKCDEGAILLLDADCRFDVGDAGSGVRFLSGPAPIEVLAHPTLPTGARNPGDDIVPGSLEPISDFGLIANPAQLQFTTPGSYVLQGFATGDNSTPDGGTSEGPPVEVKITVNPGPVGGLSVDLAGDETGLPLEAAQSSGTSAGLLAGVIAAISAVAITVTGVAWYARRRLIS